MPIAATHSLDKPSHSLAHSHSHPIAERGYSEGRCTPTVDQFASQPSSTIVLLGIPLHDRLIVPSRQNFESRLGDQNRVFELGTAFAIRRYGGPVVAPRAIGRDSQVNHGLDRKHVTHFHSTLGFVFCVVGNVGNGMEEGTNPVAAVGSYDAAFVLFGVALNDRTQVPVQCSRLDECHGARQALKGGLHQTTTVRVHVPHAIGLVQITVVSASVVRGDIQIDHVWNDTKPKGRKGNEIRMVSVVH
jgi:hypothetical protein